MSTKIVSIGEPDVILPFKAIGAEIHPVSTPEEARDVLNKLLKEDVGLILIPDDLVPHIRDFLDENRGSPLPCILPIPGGKGRSKFAIKEMRELVKKGVGVDIMK